MSKGLYPPDVCCPYIVARDKKISDKSICFIMIRKELHFSNEKYSYDY